MNRNKIIVTIVLLILVVFFIVTTCFRVGEKAKPKDLPPGTHGVIVTEVVQTSNYTYLQVEEIKNKFWIAVVKSENKPGDSIYYSQAFEMKNFESKELGRTFPSLFLVQDPSNKLVAPKVAAPAKLTPQKGEIIRRPGISVVTPPGAITIADLYKNLGNFKGKTVIIRGTVVRSNYQIMHKNWLHIQDGTDNSGKFDLTVTTRDSLTVGNTATFKGIISLNKDFGYGYSYDVIMEEASAGDISK